MSTISHCPTCGSTSKVKEKNGIINYEAVQNDEAFKKIVQLKKAMEKFKAKSEALEKELEMFKAIK
ncbi:hypothetical protein [uncultured Polaribacter sp.]|uniref:hypothetical protein n=1 Tax=uncultured Polaribacter sp. TaxID=174711 RepID=UPI0030DD0FE5|tara:strand:- start:130 stop:327 length:198 start_codon:yes stop_codon:yes gene_type:complete